MAQSLWKTVWSVLKNFKLELLYDPLLVIYPKELKAGSRRNICTPMFITALFTIAKRWKQCKCPSMDEWVKKACYMHTVQYSALKRKEALTQATTWMNPEDIMLHEISQSQKTNAI